VGTESRQALQKNSIVCLSDSGVMVLFHFHFADPDEEEEE
jgi:hypothetical protein